MICTDFLLLSPMKQAITTCLLIGCLFSLGACMWMGPDDKEFFGKGWVKPTELDGTPPRQVPVGAADDQLPGVPGPSAVSTGDWSTPARF